MIDTHCHLSYAPLLSQLDAVLDRAAASGVTRMITIGTRLADCITCRELAVRYPQIRCAVGIHPHHAGQVTEEELTHVMAMFTDPHVCAAGEMGLDYHYDFSPHDIQQRVFHRQLHAARSAGKPLVLHCREANAVCLDILRGQGHIPGVFHCFTGTMAEARRILDSGYYIGITGIVTFKNAAYLRDIARMMPADRLLIETDAPYLAPEPQRRQKSNEPSLIRHIYALIAQERGVTLGELEAQLDDNARRLFGLN
jgi:TatD DNase family protein